MCKVESGVSRLGGISFFVSKKSSASNPTAIRMHKKVDNRSLALRVKFFGGNFNFS
jgi:hypothetical protein